jgi:uncharacterized repeat protein (TIGR03803 family)
MVGVGPGRWNRAGAGDRNPGAQFLTAPGGGEPVRRLIRDSAGNLYGTAGAGGAENAGDVYKLDTTSRLTVLYSFTGGSDGDNPSGGLIRDPSGNLYGSTFYGVGGGVVFKLDTAGHETVLYKFGASADGYSPNGGVIRDAAGNLYGTTFGGGKRNGGVVFKLKGAAAAERNSGPRLRLAFAFLRTLL